jgi:hypothetical protein
MSITSALSAGASERKSKMITPTATRINMPKLPIESGLGGGGSARRQVSGPASNFKGMDERRAEKERNREKEWARGMKEREALVKEQEAKSKISERKSETKLNEEKARASEDKRGMEYSKHRQLQHKELEERLKNEVFNRRKMGHSKFVEGFMMRDPALMRQGLAEMDPNYDPADGIKIKGPGMRNPESPSNADFEWRDDGFYMKRGDSDYVKVSEEKFFKVASAMNPDFEQRIKEREMAVKEQKEATSARAQKHKEAIAQSVTEDAAGVKTFDEKKYKALMGDSPAKVKAKDGSEAKVWTDKNGKPLTRNGKAIIASTDPKIVMEMMGWDEEEAYEIMGWGEPPQTKEEDKEHEENVQKYGYGYESFENLGDFFSKPSPADQDQERLRRDKEYRQLRS